MSSPRKARGRASQLAFEALSIEGSLLSPEWLGRLAQLDAGQQSESDYRVPRGLNLRDEIGRYWRIAQAHWRDLETGRARGADPAALAARFVTALLGDVLGFASVVASAPVEREGRVFPIGRVALGGRVPVVIAPAALGLDTPSALFGEGGRRRSAFGLVQEFLNAADESLWGIACDGLTLRLLRDNASLTRPAWVEADLARIFQEERYADFAALWLLLHETRFGRADQASAECPLEAWRIAGREQGTRARANLRRGVEEALMALGQGFVSHPDNVALRAALSDRALSPQDLFQQLLRLVYRLIFLLTAEERGVLHAPDAADAARALYDEGYSLRRLRERSVRRSAHDRYGDLWAGLCIVFHAVGHGEARLGLAALGGLFAPAQCPDLDAAKVQNQALLRAVFQLSWMVEEGSLARVNWRDMGPEELGSVYESLLELVPQVALEQRRFSFATGDETRGNARKTSGSYYTPDSLVQVLLDSALEPVVAAAIAANPGDPVEALLSLSVVDPACGSGHFLLAAARRLAAHVARLTANGTPSAAEYRHALRQVVGRCIYGVDLNPMALELCRVSLWMEAVEPGLALSFLDSHLQVGNALLGATPELMEKGIPDAAWEPIEGDDRKVASALKKRNKSEAKGQQGFEALWSKPAANEVDEVVHAVEALEKSPDADLEAVEKRAAQWEAIRASEAFRHQRFVADAWCAAFVWPKAGEGPVLDAAPTNGLWRQIRGGQGHAPALTTETVKALAGQYRFFHWHLAFPQVFKRGGFDVVLGNPPWDTLSPDAKEFFSVFEEGIRFQSKGEQEATIERLLRNPAIAAAWTDTRRRIFGAAAFLKDSGRFTLFAPGNLGKGDFNLYRLFVELALRLVREHGSAAQVVPDGLYAGANSMAIRKELFEKFRVDMIFGFENAREAWFPSVDSRAKFTLYSARKGGVTDSFRAAFWIRSTADLMAAGGGASLLLPVAMVREFSPDALAVMEFRGQRDIDIARKMYSRFPALGAVVPGTSHRSYLRELESGHVQGLLTEDRTALPHYEGRMISQYDHRAKGYRSGRARAAVWDDLPFGSSVKSIQPQWYVHIDGVPDQARARIGEYRVGFCDVASPTNERSLVAAMLPRNCIAGAKVPTVVMQSATPREDLLLWLAIANSFTMDFLVRMKVSLTMALTILDSLPFPRLSSDSPVARRFVRRALMLSCTGEEMNDLWDEMAQVGIVAPRSTDSVPGTTSLDVRLRLVAENEADVALLFGLSAEDLVHILDTFPIVRRHDEKTHADEYLTKTLILRAYERLAEALRTGKPNATQLDPPPADPRVAHPDTRVVLPIVHPQSARRSLPRDAWKRPSVDQRGETGAALAAVLKAFGMPTLARGVRLAAILAMEPRLVLPSLADDEATEWRRLIGPEAAPTPAGISELVPKVNHLLGSAVVHLRANGLLVEDSQIGTWAPGPTIGGIYTDGWPDGRAGFIVEMLRRRGELEVENTLPALARRWIDGTAA